MLWFITLLVLALAAFLAIKALKATAVRKTAEQERLKEGSGLEGHLHHDAQVASESVRSTSSKSGARSNTHASAPAATETDAANRSSSIAAGIVTGANATAAVGAATVAAISNGQGGGASNSFRNAGLNTNDQLYDAQEMIKILNLAESDAGRLDISREQFTALRSGDTAATPSTEKMSDVAARLRSMLA